MELQLKLAPLWLPFLVFYTVFVLPLVALSEEGLVLLSFKAAIEEDPELSMANWNSSGIDPCSWNGITCKERKVISISLPKKSLLGSLVPSLGSLTSLRHLNLRNNRLHGSLPAGLFLATGLQSLVLYGNSISGSLPAELGDLYFLQVLDLSYNSLDGSIPASLLQCKRLKLLDLSHNNLTNSLPDSLWSNLAVLEKLSLAYNRLNGSIPSGIGNLSSLRGTVDLSHNLFTGEIPASLGNVPEKVYIDLAFNNLSGPIPQNGALVNRGPTAFIGNPGLCGPPLKNPCLSPALAGGSPPTLPSFPINQSPLASGVNDSKNRNSRGLSKTLVIAVVLCDLVAIAFMAMVFVYCYRKAISSKNDEDDENANNELRVEKKCTCFGKYESESPSENVEQFDLILLDKQIHFDLDELMKATAFVLGKSEIGIMYKVVLENGPTLAVRRLGEGGTQRFKDFQAEVEAIGKVRHPNIVGLRAYYWSIDEKLLIYDYIPNGNLSTAIHGNAETVNFLPLSWDVRLKIIKGMAKGLAFLHEFSPKKYVHGDLKPNNILLGVDMEPYISDFGLGHLAKLTRGSVMMPKDGRPTEKSQSPFSDVAVSPIQSSAFCYQAPEALKTLKPSQKWDVYSYGVVLLELISGRSSIILMDASDMDIVGWIELCIGGQKPLLDVLDPCLAREPDREDEFIAVLKIALACVQENQESRPSMRNVSDSLEKLNKLTRD